MSNASSLVHTKRLVRFAGEINLEPIRRLPDLLHDGQAKHFEHLEARFRAAGPEEQEWLEDLAADDNYYAEQLPELAGELLIVATHKTAELAIRRIVGLAYPDIPPKTVHKIVPLLAALKGKGIDLTLLPGYTAFNELRCISNSVKHEGAVNNELAPLWNVGPGAPLGNLQPHFERLADDVSFFTRALSNAVVVSLT